MTKVRYDNHSTEFGLWLRGVHEIDSGDGFLASNLDYIWMNYKTGDWMLIEEKRYMSKMKRWQKDIFRTIHKASKSDPKYRGFAFIQFEKTSPEDGKTYWNNKEISRDELVRRLAGFASAYTG